MICWRGCVTTGSGIQRRGAYRVTEVEAQELLPPWLALMMVLGTVLFAWRRESH